MLRKYRPSLIAVSLAILFSAAFILRDQSGLAALFVTRTADIALWFLAIIHVLGVLIPMSGLNLSENVTPFRIVLNSIVTLLPVSVYAPPSVTVLLILCVITFDAKLRAWQKDLKELQSNDSD